MSTQLWSWLLTIVGVTGFILAGRKVWWCWYVNIGCQVLWATYAITTKQWGFLAASCIYSGVFFSNAIEWTREHNESKRVPTYVTDHAVYGEADLSKFYEGIENEINSTSIERKNRHSSLPPFKWYGPMPEPNPPGGECKCAGCPKGWRGTLTTYKDESENFAELPEYYKPLAIVDTQEQADIAIAAGVPKDNIWWREPPPNQGD